MSKQSGMRRVSFTQQEMVSLGTSLEKKVVERLRAHGIPVRGFLHFNGVKHGVLRARNTPDGTRIIEWWPSVHAARDDGIEFGEDAESQYAAAGGTLK